MSLISAVSCVFIDPIKLVMEILFSVARQFLRSPGLSILVMAVGMNILALPLYRKADKKLKKARTVAQGLQEGKAKIKKETKGKERFLALRAFYKENGCGVKDALRGLDAFLMEVPFFVAAYGFLSSMYILEEISFGPISDLTKPDGLLSLGGISVNVLPLVMTALHIGANFLFLKDYTAKTKIAMYAMCAVYLVLLYNAPACLALYWTVKNAVCLAKNGYFRLKNGAKVLGIVCAGVGGAIVLAVLFLLGGMTLKRRALLLGVAIVFFLPLLLYLWKGKLGEQKKVRRYKPNKKAFFVGTLLLSVLTGLTIPSAVIAPAADEFININYYHNPLMYLLRSGLLAAGVFLVWAQAYYRVVTKKTKVLLEKVIFVACGISLVNFLFFAQDLGPISPYLKFDDGFRFEDAEVLINGAVVLLVGAGMYLLCAKLKWAMMPLLLSLTLAIGVMGVVNVLTISQTNQQMYALAMSQDEDDMPHFRLSKTGQNVIVFMLDRTLGEYVPYMFEEKPELKEMFDGFTYYSNTMSFGSQTNFATPALFGGYEYTPVELNKRDTELLVDKHNEALKVMPVLFSQAGFEVTVCDPPYAGYSWVPDLTIFDDYPEINTYITEGKYTPAVQNEGLIESNYRNFFCYGLMRALPVGLQSVMYNGGNYHRVMASTREKEVFAQVATSNTVATGMSGLFIDSYNVLLNLPEMTQITDENVNTYFSIDNKTAHEPMILQLPNYEPAYEVNNKGLNSYEYIIDGVELKFDNSRQVAQYQSTMAAFLQIGQWLEYLKAEGVYDNTKIILVSDHGHNMDQIDGFTRRKSTGELVELERLCPLLMVKDFGATGFTTSTEFMTNADVPTLATEGVIENPVNPFTGNPINNSEKTAHDQFAIISWNWSVNLNNGKTYLPDTWVRVRDNIWNSESWKVLEGELVLKEHKEP